MGSRDVVRICKLFPIARALEHWGESHRELLDDIAHDGLEVVQREVPGVTITSVVSSCDVDRVAAAHVEAALQAEEEGFDAVIVNCLLEPGLSAVREVVSIPAIGDTGAALHLASLVSRRFSFLLPGARPTWTPRPNRDLVAMYGFSHHVVSYRPTGVPTLGMGDRLDPESLKTILHEGRCAVEQDGAEAVIGYGGLKVIQALRDELPVPVISPVQASVLVAEMLVRSHLSHSKVAFPFPAGLNRNKAM